MRSPEQELRLLLNRAARVKVMSAPSLIQVYRVCVNHLAKARLAGDPADRLAFIATLLREECAYRGIHLVEENESRVADLLGNPADSTRPASNSGAAYTGSEAW